MPTRVPNLPSLDGSPPTRQAPDVLTATALDQSSDLDPDSFQTPDQTAAKDDFLRLAKLRFLTVDHAEAVLRQAQREDLAFFASDQWPEHIRRQRLQDGRPCLTINRLPGYVRQVTNEMRDGRPGIEVIAVDSGADPELAEVFQGIVQHIEANSDADVAYARASEAQVRTGRGWFRIIPEYADDTGFEQELRIRSIRNPNTVYFDPASQELDGSDGRYAFVVEDLPKSEFDQRFGADKRSTLETFARSGERLTDWMPEGKVRVAEYYYFEPHTRSIGLLANGHVIDMADLARPEILEALQALQIPPTPTKVREIDGRQLFWALINGGDILDGNADRTAGRPMPGRWVPIIPVYGEEIDSDGKIDYRGIIRDAVDAQRASNYWKSAKTEAVALAPKAPFVAEEGQIEGHEPEWQLANVKNFSVLKYKAKALDGHLIGPPQRNTAEPPIQAMSMLSMEAENDLRATAGFSYEVGSAEKRPEQSGRAIIARQKQGEIGNSHFAAHLSVSLRHAGRILVDLIPKYYDTPRVKRILGWDGQQREVLIHAGNPESAQQVAQTRAIAEEQVYDLAVGRYDVRCTAGISFASQRQQDQDTMTNIMQSNPAMASMLGDLFFGTMNSPIAKRAAARLQKSLPPELRDDAEQKAPPIPPELHQQMQQAQSLIDMLTKKVEEQTDQLNSRHDDNETKIRIAQIQADTAMAVAESKIVTQQTLSLLDARMKSVDRLVQIDLARMDAMASMAQAGSPSAAEANGPSSPPAPTPVPVPVAAPVPEPVPVAAPPFAGPPVAPPANLPAEAGPSAPPGA